MEWTNDLNAANAQASRPELLPGSLPSAAPQSPCTPSPGTPASAACAAAVPPWAAFAATQGAGEAIEEEEEGEEEGEEEDAEPKPVAFTVTRAKRWKRGRMSPRE